MAYELSWQPMAVQGPRVAVSSADAASYQGWMLAQMLLGRVGTAVSGLWSIYYSCGGFANGGVNTAGTPGDGVDRWGSTYALANIPNDPAGTGSHGWMVLTRQWTINAQTYNTYLLISSRGYGAASVGRIVVNVGLGVPTGGTTTADPTMSIIAAATTIQANTGADYATDFTNPRRHYGNVSTRGDFWFCETILGEFSGGSMFVNPIGCKANDQCPFWGTLGTIAWTGGGSFPYMGQNLYLRQVITSVSSGFTTYYNGAGSAYPALDQPPAFALLDASDASIFDKPAFVTVGNAVSPTAIHSRGRLPDVGLSCGVVSPGTTNAGRPVNIGTTIKDPLNPTEVVYVTANAMILPYNAAIS